MLRVIDPSVSDEADPRSLDPELNLLPGERFR